MEITKFFTAIFFDSSKKAYKYRNIGNTAQALAKFERFALTKGAIEINYYQKQDGNFSHKVKF